MNNKYSFHLVQLLPFGLKSSEHSRSNLTKTNSDLRNIQMILQSNFLESIFWRFCTTVFVTSKHLRLLLYNETLFIELVWICCHGIWELIYHTIFGKSCFRTKATFPKILCRCFLSFLLFLIKLEMFSMNEWVS